LNFCIYYFLIIETLFNPSPLGFVDPVFFKKQLYQKTSDLLTYVIKRTVYLALARQHQGMQLSTPHMKC